MAWPFQQYVSGVRGPTGFLFSAFIAADGSVLKPSIDDATRWAKSFRPLREMVGIVTRKKGLCLLRGHGSAINLPSASPRWMAAAVFFDNKWYTKGEQVLARIDEILGLLQALPTRDFNAR